uniref:Regulator of microtubule dynamics protein 2 n=1 Tax=Castor canadensis TaxID=51338 RepID=A0A8C0X9L4_CASCN
YKSFDCSGLLTFLHEFFSSFSVFQADLKLTILPCYPPECWYYRHVPHAQLHMNFKISFSNSRGKFNDYFCNFRYITANTDTEEQSFPVPKPFNTHIEELKLDVLLQKADHLRVNESGKMESFELLCDHKEKFRDEIEFMWRFARAYGDMCELSTNAEEKKHYANIGKTLGERAITRAPLNGYCHLWYAVLCGCVSEFEGLQNKINYGHHFKEHLEVAIRLLPEEPFLYYLKGRYCYTISKLSWIEKKMAATLFGKIPSSTVQEALYNFLKAEELQPGFSLSNYMHLAKCYVDLGESQDAWKFCNLALLLPVVTKEVSLNSDNEHWCLRSTLQGCQFITEKTCVGKSTPLLLC